MVSIGRLLGAAYRSQLDRRARHRAVAAENTAITLFGLETSVTCRAVVNEQASIRGHGFSSAFAALRASNDRLRNGLTELGAGTWPLRRAALAATGQHAVPDGRGQQAEQAAVKHALRKRAIQRPRQSDEAGYAQHERPRATVPPNGERQAKQGEQRKALKGVKSEALGVSKGDEPEGRNDSREEWKAARGSYRGEQGANRADTIKKSQEAFRGYKDTLSAGFIVATAPVRLNRNYKRGKPRKLTYEVRPRAAFLC